MAPQITRPSKLIEAIEADAARSLVLPPGTRLRTEVERFRRYLRRCWLRTRYYHNQGSTGHEIVQARTLAVDLVFRYAIEAAAALPDYGPLVPGSAVVALGGYGRRELSPNSDIDVQFLHERRDLKAPPSPPFLELLEESWVHNVFPKLHVVVRTPADGVVAGNEDLRSKTSLIEARLVCGDATLFARMQRRFHAGCVKGQETAYVQQRLDDQAGRRRRFGNTPYLQEPNLKNGCGGLRDYQNLTWLTYFRYGAATTQQLLDQGLIYPREREDLDQAYAFLLRVRNDLHFRNERSNDVLLKAVQPAVARAMSFHDGSPRKRVDRLMGAYYRHVGNIHDITRQVEQRLALLPQPGRLPRLSDFFRARRRRAAYEVDGFKFVDGAVIPTSERALTEKPSRLLRGFVHAQTRGLQLHPELLQLIREHTRLVTPAFRRDRVVHQMFLDLLKRPGAVAPVLRQMHEARLLGAFLPAFGRITAQVQHEFFHQFTADEHTLVCLERLDDIWREAGPAFRPYADMFRRLERPELLYLALVLHDTGKGDGPDHTTSGARIARTVARQLGLDDAAVRRVEFLVRHHLDMVSVSQKRNLADPHVIQSFAERVGDLENLRALTLLTVADSMGTSDKLWTSFKDALLLTLFHRTQEHLEGEGVVAEEAGRTRLRDEVVRLGSPGLAADELEAHFAQMPASYFLHAEVREVLADLEVAHDFLRAQVLGDGHPLEPIIRSQNQPDRGCAVVRCCTWDRRGLFARLTGAFAAAQVNILSADIYSRGDGLVLDTFHVADPAHAAPPSARALEQFTTLARQALTGELDLGALLERPSAIRSAIAAASATERPRTAVVLDDHSSPHQTIIEVDTEDRLGLLYTITTILTDLGLDVRFARINTANGVASDAFYVVDQEGGPVRSAARQKQVRSTLLAAIARL